MTHGLEKKVVDEADKFAAFFEILGSRIVEMVGYEALSIASVPSSTFAWRVDRG